MIYATYFDRAALDDHITLDEWQAAMDAVPNVRIASADTADSKEWIGYLKNPSSNSHQIDDLTDRQNDADVYCPSTQNWRRAFYWFDAFQHLGSGVGVINFETPIDILNDPIWTAAQALARELGAELVGEDDTKYES